MLNYSLRQIRDSHFPKRDYDKQFPVSFFVVRPLSFYTTYLLLRVTHSPSRVAYFGLAIGLVACGAFLVIPELSLWPGLLILVLYILFDASDGNIARVTNNVTYYGRFLDGVVGEIIDGGYFFWLGLGMYRKPGDFVFLDSTGGGPLSSNFTLFLAGVIITWARLYGNRIMVTYYTYYARKHGDSQQEEGEIKHATQTSGYRSFWWYLLFVNVGSIDLQMVFLAVCGIFHVVELFLLFYAAYYLFQAILFTGFYLYRAQRVLS